jgi:hypothetical protein
MLLERDKRVCSLNIIELRDRLSEIIKENDRRFPSENRNQCPLFAHVQISKRIVKYTPIKYAESSLCSFINDKKGFILHLDNDNALEYGRNRKRE